MKRAHLRRWASRVCLQRAPARLGIHLSPALHLDHFDQPLRDRYGGVMEGACVEYALDGGVAQAGAPRRAA